MKSQARFVFASVLSLAFSAPLMLAAPELAIAGDASKSPAADDIMLGEGSKSHLEKKLADKADWGTDSSARESGKTAIDSLKSAIKRVKQKDPKWDLSAWEKVLKQGEDRLAKAEATAGQAASADKDNYERYKAYVWGKSEVADALTLIGKVQVKPNDVEISSDQWFEKNIAAIVKIEKLDKTCKDKKSLTAKAPPEYSKETPNAADGCKLAASWKALGKKYFELQAKGQAKADAARHTTVTASIKKGEAVEFNDYKNLSDTAAHIARKASNFDKWGKPVEAKTDTKWFDATSKLGADFPAVLKTASETSRWDATANKVDPGTTALFAANHKAGGDSSEADVIKVAAKLDWLVEKDMWNVPTTRNRTVDVMVKEKGASHCIVYTRSVSSTFKSGAWSKPFSMGALGKLKVSACK
jgi:hypothetical protein